MRSERRISAARRHGGRTPEGAFLRRGGKLPPRRSPARRDEDAGGRWREMRERWGSGGRIGEINAGEGVRRAGRERRAYVQRMRTAGSIGRLLNWVGLSRMYHGPGPGMDWKYPHRTNTSTHLFLDENYKPHKTYT